MSTIVCVVASIINVLFSLLLFAHAVHYCLLYINFDRTGIVESIYCLLFSLFLLATEIGSIEAMFKRNFRFIKKPMGRGLAYIFFVTLSITWYGIASLLSFIFFGFGFVVFSFLYPNYSFSSLVPSFKLEDEIKMIEASIGNPNSINPSIGQSSGQVANI
ncbi:hypothetical protein K502DRAFT_366436 [Neoconidiobolus thromboides FSU 785]|nr:hypothetical protein K502DRAFT_366436 [Neoconidiobolus thromboides FSU 785]